MGIDVGHACILDEDGAREEFQDLLYLEHSVVAGLLLVVFTIDSVHDLLPSSLMCFIFYLTINFGNLPVEYESEELFSALIIQEFIVFVCGKLMNGGKNPVSPLISAHLVFRSDSHLEDVKDARKDEIEPEIQA